MKRMSRVSKSVNILAVVAIATTGIITPAITGNDIATSQGSFKLAQRSLVGQCRSAKVQIPVYKAPDTTSEALRLLAPDEQVTLAGNAVKPSGFIAISTPVIGFVQALNLQSCSSSVTAPSPSVSTAPSPSPSISTTPSPSPSVSPVTSPSPSTSPATRTNKNLCRQVVQPTQGLVIRREASIKAALVGRVAYLGKVTLTTNPPTTKRADDRDWVEISSPARGWVSNSLLTEPKSNLAFCD